MAKLHLCARITSVGHRMCESTGQELDSCPISQMSQTEAREQNGLIQCPATKRHRASIKLCIPVFPPRNHSSMETVGDREQGDAFCPRKERKRMVPFSNDALEGARLRRGKSRPGREHSR